MDHPENPAETARQRKEIVVGTWSDAPMGNPLVRDAVSRLPSIMRGVVVHYRWNRYGLMIQVDSMCDYSDGVRPPKHLLLSFAPESPEAKNFQALISGTVVWLKLVRATGLKICRERVRYCVDNEYLVVEGDWTIELPLTLAGNIFISWKDIPIDNGDTPFIVDAEDQK